MSIAALKWVFDDVDCPSAHATLVLFVYANFANAEGRAYPSTETVGAKTKQNVKTVRASIDLLERVGLLIDTGRRVGRTGNVKVYALGMEGLPEVGALQGEVAPEASGGAQAPVDEESAETLPQTGALKPPVSGSKDSRFREAEPVREPIPPEDADASSPPRRGARKRCGAGAWQVPPISALPPEVRAVARQWPAGAYAVYGAAHGAWLAGGGGRRARGRDPDRSWHARILDLGAQPLRDAKAGLSYAAGGSPAGPIDKGRMIASWEDTAVLYERMGRRDEARDLRRQAAAARAGP